MRRGDERGGWRCKVEVHYVIGDMGELSRRDGRWAVGCA